LKPLGGQLGISSPLSDANPFPVSPERSVLVLFDDQSNMKTKTAVRQTIPLGGKVKSVHEAKAEFKIDFDDGSSATPLPGRSGFVRCCPR